MRIPFFLYTVSGILFFLLNTGPATAETGSSQMLPDTSGSGVDALAIIGDTGSIAELEFDLFAFTSRNPIPLPGSAQALGELIFRIDDRYAMLQFDTPDGPPLGGHHVYHRAMIVLHELDIIWGRHGIAEPAQHEAHRERSLREIYVEALGLLDDIRRNSEAAGFGAAAEMPPFRPTHDDAKFADVMDILNSALVELVAYRMAIGSDAPVRYALPAHADRVPVNLYEVLALSRTMMRELAPAR